nr:hypothetical protein [Halorubrum sp. Boch-26]
MAAKRAFNGFGGKLGTTAFAACLVTAGLLSVGRALAPVGSDAGELTLTTGRVIRQFNSGTFGRRSDRLMAMRRGRAPDPPGRRGRRGLTGAGCAQPSISRETRMFSII